MTTQKKELLYKEFLKDGNVRLNKMEALEFINYLFYMEFHLKEFKFKTERKGVNSFLITKELN